MDNRYAWAAENECGLMYRPGELSLPGINYCKLKLNHPGNTHSTRYHKHDPGGYEWTVDPDKVELEWPEFDCGAQTTVPCGFASCTRHYGSP